MNYVRTFLMVLIVAMLLCSSNVLGTPTTANQAQKVVEGWLKTDSSPLGAMVSRQVNNIETLTDESGEPIYYIAYLQPSGFVIVSADNRIEPIIGFAEEGNYDPSLDNPLGDLVNLDLKERLRTVRQISPETISQLQSGIESIKNKWTTLENMENSQQAGDIPSQMLLGLGSISEPRVDPLVLSKWAQQTCGTSPPLAC